MPEYFSPEVPFIATIVLPGCGGATWGYGANQSPNSALPRTRTRCDDRAWKVVMFEVRVKTPAREQATIKFAQSQLQSPGLFSFVLGP
jgi:hypothetical protein